MENMESKDWGKNHGEFGNILSDMGFWPRGAHFGVYSNVIQGAIEYSNCPHVIRNEKQNVSLLIDGQSGIIMSLFLLLLISPLKV